MTLDKYSTWSRKKSYGKPKKVKWILSFDWYSRKVLFLVCVLFMSTLTDSRVYWCIVYMRVSLIFIALIFFFLEMIFFFFIIIINFTIINFIIIITIIIIVIVIIIIITVFVMYKYVQICIKYLIYMTVILSLCLIAEGSNCKFWEKNPQVHIMTIKKNNP